jgi:DNA-directed RNA polymerase beta subunit
LNCAFKKYELGEAKCTPEYAKENKLTYDAPLRAQVILKNKTFESEKDQEMFLADMPVMTENGTFHHQWCGACYRATARA